MNFTCLYVNVVDTIMYMDVFIEGR